MAKRTSKLDISALVLAKNESSTIKDCLKQLDFVKEIIVLNQSSTDDTVKIAEKYTKKIINSTDENFASNRSTLQKAAKCKWLLYLDPDERINEKNILEIKSAITKAEFGTYYFARKNIILGRWLKHGGWWPDYVPRLFLKKALVGWSGRVHESPDITGNIGYMEQSITHLTARSLEGMMNKSIKWAKIEADLSYRAKHPKVNELRIIKAAFREFVARYFFKLGLLDGTVGLMEAVYQGLHQAIMLVYLWEIQKNSKEKNE